MLMMGEKVEKQENGKYGLTEEGKKMAENLRKEQDGVMGKIRLTAIHLEAMIRQKDIVAWYKDLKIVL